MAKTKLTQLEVNEVSLVDAGANQHAHVMLFKSKDGKPEGKQQAEKPESGLRKLFSAIGKALNVPDKDVEEAVSSIEKADTFSDKMEQRKKSRILDEIWDVCYALENSLCSIVRDDEVADKAAMMDQSIDEFTETIKTLTASWGNGKTAQITKAAEEIPLEHMQESANRLEGMIAKACGGTGKPASKSEGGEDDPPEDGQGEEADKADKGCKKSKGGIPDMKFNEANMTATDRMAFEELKKRYGVDEGDGGTTGEEAGTEQVGKKGTADQAGAEGAAGAAAGEPAAQTGAAGDDIYKGLNPAVAAELKELRKRADAAEERELLEVAKRYEIIGKKPEELVQTFKSLKAAGGTAYNDMISVLDSAVAMTEQSGVFGEIGKRGNGTGNNGTDAWSKIEKHAADIRKADPALGYAEAIDKACIQHPELVSEYEANR